MKKIIIVLCVFVLFGCSKNVDSNSENGASPTIPQKTFKLTGSGNDYGRCLVVNPNGSCVIGGTDEYIYGGGSAPYFLALDSNGNIEVQKTYIGMDEFYSLCPAHNDYGYYAAGTYKMFFIDPYGTTLIGKTISGDIPKKINKADSPNHYIACFYNGIGYYNNTCDELWFKNYTDYKDIIYLQSGGFAAIGDDGDDVIFSKFDMNGNIQSGFPKYFGESGISEMGSSLKQLISGDFELLLYTNSGIFKVIKINSSGEYISHITYNFSPKSIQYVFGIFSLDGTYTFAYAVTSDYSLWIFNGGANGNVKWELKIDSPGEEVPTGLGQSNDGSYIISGYSESTSDPTWDIFAAKISADGKRKW